MAHDEPMSTAVDGGRIDWPGTYQIGSTAPPDIGDTRLPRTARARRGARFVLGWGGPSKDSFSSIILQTLRRGNQGSILPRPVRLQPRRPNRANDMGQWDSLVLQTQTDWSNGRIYQDSYNAIAYSTLASPTIRSPIGLLIRGRES